jgi:uncharacterized membrane protein (UPF0127 family)
MRKAAGCAILLLALVACGGSPPPPTSRSAPPSASQAIAGSPVFPRGQVTIQTKSGSVMMPVEIADDEAKQEYGLMNRTSLPADAGMLFVFQPPANAKQIGFWMKDTLIPLSIAFVDPNLAIESIQDMQPQSEQVHYAPADYGWAIEANAGFFANHGVGLGDKITIQK